MNYEASISILTNMIVEQLSWHGGILEMELIKKLICFGCGWSGSVLGIPKWCDPIVVGQALSICDWGP